VSKNLKKKLFSFTDTTNLMTSNHTIVTHRASCMFNKIHVIILRYRWLWVVISVT